MAGWGITTHPDGKPNAILQKIHVRVLSNALCELALMEDLGPGNLCAMALPKQGTCFVRFSLLLGIMVIYRGVYLDCVMGVGVLFTENC